MWGASHAHPSSRWPAPAGAGMRQLPLDHLLLLVSCSSLGFAFEVADVARWRQRSRNPPVCGPNQPMARVFPPSVRSCAPYGLLLQLW
eukprot:scaffold7729_cov120-Isochrysis_galbana.AAC.4